MSGLLDKVASVAVVLAAVAVGGTTLKREFSPQPVSASTGMPEPRLIEDWRTFLSYGIVEGDTSAPAQVIELADFECPFCARMDASVNALKEKMGADLAYTYVHFPIAGHRFALPAARAAECAGGQGRFGAMRTGMFAKQDSLGLKSWESFAQDAGVPDLDQFNTCAADTARVKRIADGIALGERLQIRGTPTLIINGWLYYGVHPESLEREVLARMKK